MADKKKTDPVPEHFGTYDEAAEFWETHDTTDYSEIFRTVEEGSRGGLKDFGVARQFGDLQVIGIVVDSERRVDGRDLLCD